MPLKLPDGKAWREGSGPRTPGSLRAIRWRGVVHTRAPTAWGYVRVEA